MKKETKGKHYFTEKILNRLDHMRLRKKLWLIQIFCVLLPLLVSDSVIFSMIINEERRAARQETYNAAEAVKYTISDSVKSAVGLMQNIYVNRYVNEFIKQEFTSPLDYYDKYLKFIKDSLYAVGVSNGHYNAVIYCDNDGIVNGGYFQRLDMAQDAWWYRELEDSGREVVLFSEYVEDGRKEQRAVSLVRHMDYYRRNNEKSVIRIDLDYSGISQQILNAQYDAVLYVCDGDRILFSNDGRGGLQVPFERMDAALAARADAHTTMNIYGSVLDIYAMQPEIDAGQVLLKNLPLIAGLLCLNVLLPFLIMGLINRSFTERLQQMEKVFGGVEGDELVQLPEVRGSDEIGSLMQSYNRMAQRMNELIQTVYKNRLRSQEIDIARQKAELLALHSQINPHFLFNALESIRMHSVLKREYETADMVQKLALMERQNVEWGGDLVRIGDEIRFIEAYLELQKYRFGERLSYQINVDEECMEYRIPKLSVVTFVENACVHGMEKKTLASWVFVRIYIEDGRLVMEVEDTGNGMQEEQCRQMLEDMRNVRIEMLKSSRHVGILNAALRLKMASEDTVSFEMDSEPGAGTMVLIRIPTEKLPKAAEEAEEQSAEAETAEEQRVEAETAER